VASTTFARAERLRTEDVEIDGEVFTVVKDFAIFIDTHRDQPHVGMFEDDIHRGTCKPTMVHLMPPASGVTTEWSDWSLVRASDGLTLPLHSKHKFVDKNWYHQWVMDYVLEHGEAPLGERGFMFTTKLRDARAGVYKLRSFRQMVVERQRLEGTY
jgi:hypothetical protein